MGRFNRRQKKTRKWIKGPLHDWIIPYRCNFWFQLGHALLIAVALNAGVFWITRSANAVASAVLLFILSVVILGGTEFGRGTVKAYRRTREIIENKGTLGHRVQIEFGKKLYCFRAGVRTAAIDCGRAHELIPALANKWRPF
jgi:hypothetical protein